MGGELLNVVVEAVLGGFESVAGIFEFFGFAIRGVSGGEDPVIDEDYSEVAELLVEPVSYGGGEVGFEFVDLELSKMDRVDLPGENIRTSTSLSSGSSH